MDVPAPEWSDLEILGALRVQTRWWDLGVAGRRPEVAALADPATTEAAAVLGEAMTALDLDPGPDPGRGGPPGSVAGRRGRALHDSVRVRRPWDVALRAVLVAATAGLVPPMRAARRAVVEADPPPSPDGSLPCGTVVRVASSSGGVPKTAVTSARVDARGVVGDGQAHPEHHGRPFQALCLWSAEVIEVLRAEGHPVEAGSCGENVLVSGLRWADVRPGVRLHLGPDVVAEIAGPAEPCSTIAASFHDRRPNRVSHDRYPGSSRLYAWVEAGGVMRPGDAITMS